MTIRNAFLVMDTPSPPKQYLLTSLVGIGALAMAMVAFIFYYSSFQAVEKLSQESLDGSAELAQAKLHTFFRPLQDNLLVTHDWTKGGEVKLDNTEELNRRFVPLLARHTPITSMLIADENGREYMLLNDKGTWVNRRVDVAKDGKTTRWFRWNTDLEPVEEWTKELEYDPRLRPWFRGAMEHPEGEPHWTEPYIFFTTRDVGMTVSSRLKTSDGTTMVVAFDVMLKDLSAFTSTMKIGENGIAVLLTEEGTVIGLPSVANGANPQEYLLKPLHQLENDALNRAWKGSGTRAFSFHSDGQAWWAVTRPFEMGTTRLWIVVAAPDSDFSPDAPSQFIWLGILLAAILGIALLLYRRLKIPDAPKQDKNRLGAYVLGKVIGTGGAGEVYLAEHRSLRRITALKVIKDTRDRKTRERFKHEVRVTASLTHPNTVTVYDFGTQGETLFFAMEYLEGATVGEVVERSGPMPPERVIHILEQVCGSLEEAHAKGFIHRDIKPDNVFLAHRGSSYDFVKVLDFGLVKEVDAEISPGKSTRLMGTPGYIAPEAAAMGYRPRPSADIYAIGALAYLMISGKPAYEGTSRASIFAQQKDGPPPLPSEKLNGKVPEDLERLIMQCLSQEQDLRPESVTSILSRLHTCKAYGLWTAHHAEEWWLNHQEISNSSSNPELLKHSVQTPRPEERP